MSLKLIFNPASTSVFGEMSDRFFGGALGIQQMIELGEWLANRALDKVDPR